MIVKQKNLRVFDIEIENEEDFFLYFKKNIVLLREYFLLLKGSVTDKIVAYLEKEGVCFKDISSCDKKSLFWQKSRQKVESKENKDKTKKESIVAKTMIFHRPIRSGEEIVAKTDVIVFGRVNSGSKLICSSNVQIFGTVDGIVQCDGEFMIVQKLGQGSVIFNGEILDKEDFEGVGLKKIFLENEKIVIKDLF